MAKGTSESAGRMLEGQEVSPVNTDDLESVLFWAHGGCGGDLGKPTDGNIGRAPRVDLT